MLKSTAVWFTANPTKPPSAVMTVAGLLAAALLICLIVLLPSVSRKRNETFKEDA